MKDLLDLDRYPIDRPDSPEAVRPFARSFHQEAFFWVEDGTVFVINTEGTRRHRVAEWAERQV